MPKYHLTYGGPNHMPETDDAMAAMMQAWEAWFASLGESLVDPGSPFGTRRMVPADGSAADTGGSNGYGVIEATDLDDAVAKVRGCPVLSLGSDNHVEVCEFLAVG